MKTTLAFVSTLNGKITLGNNPNVTVWTSKADQLHFKKLVKDHSVIITGRRTYQAAKPNLKLQKNKLRLVITTNPGKYRHQAIPGQLEFTNSSPKKIINRLTAEGYKKTLLAAGSNLSSQFLNEHLIDEFQLTIEPKLFNSGICVFSHLNSTFKLKLITYQTLNPQGTLLLHYKIIYE